MEEEEEDEEEDDEEEEEELDDWVDEGGGDGGNEEDDSWVREDVGGEGGEVGLGVDKDGLVMDSSTVVPVAPVNGLGTEGGVVLVRWDSPSVSVDGGRGDGEDREEAEGGGEEDDGTSAEEWTGGDEGVIGTRELAPGGLLRRWV